MFLRKYVFWKNIFLEFFDFFENVIFPKKLMFFENFDILKNLIFSKFFSIFKIFKIMFPHEKNIFLPGFFFTIWNMSLVLIRHIPCARGSVRGTQQCEMEKSPFFLYEMFSEDPQLGGSSVYNTYFSPPKIHDLANIQMLEN